MLAGWVLEHRRTAPVTTEPVGPVGSPREELERSIQAELERGPCAVAFSGGVDSSLVLAAAVHVARRDGFELPVPITRRFPGLPETDESEHQEVMVRHLGLDDWVVYDDDGSVDLLGPAAQARILRWGPLWPPLLAGNEPLLRRAAGRTVLTGEGGDEVLGVGPWWPAALLRARKGRLRRKDVRAIVKWSRRGRSPEAPRPWLRPPVLAEIEATTAHGPRHGHRRPSWFVSRRASRMGFANLQLLAEELGSRLVHPLADPGLADALGRRSGAGGPVSRAQVIRRSFSGLVPVSIERRETKVAFNRAAFGAGTRRHIEEAKLDRLPNVVDPDALRRAWRRDDARTALLVQASWLRDHGA